MVNFYLFTTCLPKEYAHLISFFHAGDLFYKNSTRKIVVLTTDIFVVGFAIFLFAFCDEYIVPSKLHAFEYYILLCLKAWCVIVCIGLQIV